MSYLNKNLLSSNELHPIYQGFYRKNTKNHYNPDRSGTVQHIFLDLFLDFESETLAGVAQITHKCLRSGLKTLSIDAVDMEIASVEVNYQRVDFNYDKRVIHIRLNEPTEDEQYLIIAISYKTIQPILGIIFVKPTTENPHKPLQVWSQGESTQSRYWYPCFDYPRQICTSEIRANIPEDMLSVSNGVLVDTVVEGGRKIDHWKQSQPHPSYLMSLTAGELMEIRDEAKIITEDPENPTIIPLTYYTQPKLGHLLQTTAYKTPKMIQFFSHFFGVTYPWNKYAQTWVHEFIWGGMENTSATVNTDRALVDKRASLDYDFGEILIAHELSHQWFGDLVVIDHWSNLWIKEGAATLSESLWVEYEYGKDEYDYYRFREVLEYLDESKSSYTRPTMSQSYQDEEDLYDRHSYTKAGCIYAMLRSLVGSDELFTKSLKTFLTTHRHQNVDGKDLVRAFDISTGINIQPLLDQYIYRAGHPKLKVTYSWNQEGGMAKVEIEQTQAINDSDKDNLFDLRCEIDFGVVDNQESETTRYTINVDKKSQIFYFKLSEKPSYISVDPDQKILKEIQLSVPLPELVSQLQYDISSTQRIYAAQAIAKENSLERVTALEEQLDRETFWGVKAEIVDLLGKIQHTKSIEVLIDNINQENPKVRKSIMASLSTFRTAEVFSTLKTLAEKGDESYFVEAESIKSLGVVASYLGIDFEIQTIELCKDVLEKRAGWNEVVRAAALQALKSINTNKDALEIIVFYSQQKSNPTLQAAAISALGHASLGQNDQDKEAVLNILKTMSGERYVGLERATVTALSQMNSEKAVSVLRQIQQSSYYGRVRNSAEDAINSIYASKKDSQSIMELRQMVEKLSEENRELKTRVDEITTKA